MAEAKTDVIETEEKEAVQVEEVKGDRFVGRVLYFEKPFNFEGKIYKELDFSALDELTGGDHINASNMAARMNQTNGLIQSPAPQLDTTYQYALASFATGLPIEAFAAMPYRAALLISGYIRNFTLGRG